jgi:hypothetical protein
MRRLARPLAQISQRAIRRHPLPNTPIGCALQSNASLSVAAQRWLSTPTATTTTTPPPQQRVYGGLKDQDRIFTNLYGEQDWGIDGALKRV